MSGTPSASQYSNPALARTAATVRVDPAIEKDIRDASRAANVDFSFLMAQAAQESGFRPDATAATSSASGLFQFVDSTWLDMVRQHGAKYGIGDLAQGIGINSRGQPFVADPALRRQILDLRSDPRLSAAFAAEYARDNKTILETELGHTVGPAELRLAHFLGAGGASDLLSEAGENPSTPAADILPEAAAANRGIFYDESGHARTVAEIYQRIASEVGASRSVHIFDSGLKGDLAASGAADGGTKAGGVYPAGMPGSLLAATTALGAGALDPTVIATLNSLVFTALHLVPDAGSQSGGTAPTLAAAGGMVARTHDPKHDHRG